MEYDWFNHKVKIGDGYFNPNYIKAIITVADVNQTEKIIQKVEDINAVNLFEVDGIEILLMPFRINFPDETKKEYENPHEVKYEEAL